MFFVSGVSGSFQKHRKLLLDDAKIQPAHAEIKYVSQPVIEKSQKAALRAEALALMQMEEQLMEVNNDTHIDRN